MGHFVACNFFFRDAGRNIPATFPMSGDNFENDLTVVGTGSATVKSFTWLSATSISVTVLGTDGNHASGGFTVTNPDGGTVTALTGSFLNG